MRSGPLSLHAGGLNEVRSWVFSAPLQWGLADVPRRLMECAVVSGPQRRQMTPIGDERHKDSLAHFLVCVYESAFPFSLPKSGLLSLALMRNIVAVSYLTFSSYLLLSLLPVSAKVIRNKDLHKSTN